MDKQYSHSSRQSCQPQKHETNATKAAAVSCYFSTISNSYNS
jgi:hypothetical protein